MRRFRKLAIWSAVVVTIVIAVAAFLAHELTLSLIRADCTLLNGCWKQWVAAGKPGEDKLSEFMRGRDYFLVNTQALNCDGMSYQCIFQLRRPAGLTSGTWIITTNGIIIEIKPDGRTERIKDFDSEVK
jgi:hypothetical protein